MKNKFILYVIALLLLFNVIFQFVQLFRIGDMETEVKEVERRNSSELSSFRRSQGKKNDSQEAEISQLRNEIDAVRAENGQLRSQLQQLGRRVSPPGR
jgi:predicted RNase H-like nuclease (RuvC/YqgF family)